MPRLQSLLFALANPEAARAMAHGCTRGHFWRQIEDRPHAFYCWVCEAIKIVDDDGNTESFTTKESRE